MPQKQNARLKDGASLYNQQNSHWPEIPQRQTAHVQQSFSVSVLDFSHFCVSACTHGKEQATTAMALPPVVYLYQSDLPTEHEALCTVSFACLLPPLVSHLPTHTHTTLMTHTTWTECILACDTPASPYHFPNPYMHATNPTHAIHQRQHTKAASIIRLVSVALFLSL